MKIIINTCAGREKFVEYLTSIIPNAIINYDDFPPEAKGKMTTTAWNNYCRGWKLAGNSPCLQLDDDIILCDNFIEKVEAVVDTFKNDVVQFFSMRKKDLSVGTRWEAGATFLMQQCYYLPAGMAKEIHEFSSEFYDYTQEITCPTDHVISDYLQKNKKRYLIYVPNLFNHRVAVSAIDKRRSSKRQSFTFQQQ
jgi:hypothetical protein